jgi:hypothetical protein
MIAIVVIMAFMMAAQAFVQPLTRIGTRIDHALFAKKGTKITPNEGESMEEYRKSILNIIKQSEPDDRKLGGREILNLLINKWGAAYDLQIRKNTPFGEESANVYINVMWQYFGQKSFRMEEREYLEHLEAIGRYITSVNRVAEFREAISDSRKRPNAYFGYAVGIPLDVKPDTADRFFKDLPYD